MRALSAFVAVGVSCAVAWAGPDATFTCQGSLSSGGEAASGLVDMSFRLYDAPAGGSLVGGPIAMNDVEVSNGLFGVALDFGAASFSDDGRWLQITVEGIGVSTPGAKLEVREDDTEAILGVSTFQNGVYGASAAASRAGVAGSTTSATGFGVHGSTSVLNGSARGVFGSSFAETGAGVYGLAQNENGENYGVCGDPRHEQQRGRLGGPVPRARVHA